MGKLIKGFIILLGVVILVIAVVFFVWDTSKVITWSRSGFVLCSVRQSPEGRIAFFGVDPEDFVGPQIPSRGDTLFTLQDSVASLQRWIDVLESPHIAGREVAITYLHEGDTLSTMMRTRPVQKAHFLGVTVLQGLKLLISLSFLLVGFWAFFKRADSAGVRILILYCLSMVAPAILSYMPMFPVMASFQIPFVDGIRTFLISLWFFFSSFWLLLNMVFPRPVRLMRSRPWLAYALCFGPQLIVIAIAVVAFNFAWLRFVAYGIIVVQIVTGLAILRHNHITARNTLERRQTKLVFWGSGASLVIIMLYVLDWLQIVPVTINLQLLPRLLIYNAVFFLVLASPISFAYAFRRYRLMDVEIHLRRGTRYLLVTLFLLATFFAVLYGVSQLLLNTLHMESRTPTVAVALLLALVFIPIHRRAQSVIEHRFYPERTRLRKMLEEFLATTSSMPDRATLWARLEENLKQGLGIASVIPVLSEDDHHVFQLPDGEAAPLDPEGSLVHELEAVSRPVVVDELTASGRVKLSDKEEQWLRASRVALLLPMIVQSRLIGLLAITFEEEHEDMAAEDIAVLSSVVSQVALQSENLRLLEDNLDKRRLQEQLEMARRVQKGFLPARLPATPGLEVAARNRFCLEVAGDYYDVIPLENGETVLAVADVSGKGAGAALLMANLQACVRTAVGMGTRLADIVSRINDLICSNTPIEEYITFFVGVHNPESHEFTYVNAGHNPPVLVRRSGAVESLDKGGLILGMLPRLDYDQETVTLAPGELLLMYTDGVSEAMNSLDEEFGAERVKRLLLEHRALPARDLVARLEAEVVAFAGSDLLEDDFTLLAARIEKK